MTNLVTAPPTRLGVVAYTVAQWPTTPTPISFSFDFLTGSTVDGRRPADRIGVCASGPTPTRRPTSHCSTTTRPTPRSSSSTANDPPAQHLRATTTAWRWSWPSASWRRCSCSPAIVVSSANLTGQLDQQGQPAQARVRGRRGRAAGDGLPPQHARPGRQPRASGAATRRCRPRPAPRARRTPRTSATAPRTRRGRRRRWRSVIVRINWRSYRNFEELILPARSFPRSHRRERDTSSPVREGGKRGFE